MRGTLALQGGEEVRVVHIPIAAKRLWPSGVPFKSFLSAGAS